MSLVPSMDAESLKNINLLIGCFFFAFTGAYLQEVLNIYKGKQRVTKIHKVVIGTIIGMSLYLILTAKFLKGMNISLSVAVNVLCGLLGYEIFNKCSSIEGIKQTASDINEIFGNLLGIKDYLDKLFKSDSSKPDQKNDHTG